MNPPFQTGCWNSASRRKNTDFGSFSARSADFSRMSGGLPSLHGGFSRRNFTRTSKSDSLLGVHLGACALDADGVNEQTSCPIRDGEVTFGKEGKAGGGFLNAGGALPGGKTMNKLFLWLGLCAGLVFFGASSSGQTPVEAGRRDERTVLVGTDDGVYRLHGRIGAQVSSDSYFSPSSDSYNSPL
jgi:hypothetical protein